MKKILTILMVFIVISANAQISYNVEPVSEKLKIKEGITKIPSFQLPSYSNISLFDKFNCDTCYKDYYGMMIEQNIDPMIDGIWENIDEKWIWRVKIKSPTAKAIEIGFKHFNLQEEQHLFAYSKSSFKGAYTHRNNQPDSLFVISQLTGNEITIEFNSNKKPVKTPFIIFGFVHVFDDDNSVLYKNESLVNKGCAPKKGVNCAPFKQGWCNEIRASFQLRNLKHKDGDGASICSATLINNCQNDFEPYVLTAAHCIEGSEDFQSQWIGRFNYQNRECITESYTNINTIGNEEMQVVGLTLLEQTTGLNHPDVALLKFYQKPPIGYNVYYAGWEAYDGTYLDGTKGVGISHPRGGTKKGSHGIISECAWPLHKFYIAHWFDGYTDKGSSGSGLFNKNGRLVGVCSWSLFKCQTYYGQLSHAYTKINKHIGDGCDFDRFGHLNGLDPIWACQENIEVIGDMYPAFDWQDKNNIIIQASKQITADGAMSFNESPSYLPSNFCNYTFRAGKNISLTPGFVVEEGHTFRAEIGSCLEGSGCGFNYPPKTYWESENEKEFTVEFSKNKNFIHENEIEIFPNPASDFVFILFKLDKVQDIEIELYDFLGKHLKTISKRNMKFDKLKIELKEISTKQIYISIKSEGKEIKTENIYIK